MEEVIEIWRDNVANLSEKQATTEYHSDEWFDLEEDIQDYFDAIQEESV